MTGWQIVGVCILAAPFVTLIGWMLADDWLETLIVVGGTALVVGIALLGAVLVTGGWAP